MGRMSMRRWSGIATLAFVFGITSVGAAQPTPSQSSDTKLPPPGSRGNADNVPYIGGRDPNNNPVRLARATGHVSNYSEEKVAPYTLPDPLLLADGRRVSTSAIWLKERRPEILKYYRSEIYGRVP